jgi:hypothetical protein
LFQNSYTAIIVLENEEQYREFGIDRRALADILVVTESGVAVLDRNTAGSTHTLPPRAPTTTVTMLSSAAETVDEGEAEGDSTGTAQAPQGTADDKDMFFTPDYPDYSTAAGGQNYGPPLAADRVSHDAAASSSTSISWWLIVVCRFLPFSLFSQASCFVS